MREYKFRAWNKVMRKMVDLRSITPLALSDSMNDQMTIQGSGGVFLPFRDDFEIMQYTGLKDKNSKEIYEGDILLYQGVDDLKPFYYEVQQRCGNWMACNELYFDLKDTDFIRIEIIGNIHENDIGKL